MQWQEAPGRREPAACAAVARGQRAARIACIASAPPKARPAPFTREAIASGCSDSHNRPCTAPHRRLRLNARSRSRGGPLCIPRSCRAYMHATTPPRVQGSRRGRCGWRARAWAAVRPRGGRDAGARARARRGAKHATNFPGAPLLGAARRTRRAAMRARGRAQSPCGRRGGSALVHPPSHGAAAPCLASLSRRNFSESLWGDSGTGRFAPPGSWGRIVRGQNRPVRNTL